MRFLFWNVGGASISQTVGDAVRENNIDVLILAESTEPIVAISIALNEGSRRPYVVPRGLPPDVRRSLRVLARLPLDALSPIRDDDGISALGIVPILGPSITLISLHLRSKLHQDPEDQTIAAVELRRIIDLIEDKVGHRRTVLVGDLNMNPFERGVVAADALHGVMSRTIAARGYRTVAKQEKAFFYNPMWNHFGDRGPSPPGTYYRDASARTNYFWNMFDQVLVRPDLLRFFADEQVRILTSIGGTSLLTARGVPDSTNASDHLPLVFELDVEKGDE